MKANVLFIWKIELCKRFNKLYALLYDETTIRTLTRQFYSLKKG